jgi:hypothetical protein
MTAQLLSMNTFVRFVAFTATLYNKMPFNQLTRLVAQEHFIMNTFLVKSYSPTVKTSLGRLPSIQAFCKLPLQHAAAICHHAHGQPSPIPSFHVLGIFMEIFPLVIHQRLQDL